MKKDIAIYQDGEQGVRFDVRIEDETVWLNRLQLALLFDRDIKTIGKHIANIFKEKELDEKSVVAIFATTAQDQKTYSVEHYNLDVIISVGYRVKSKRGVQFRQWATARLKEYLVEGYSLNQKRLEERNLEIKRLQDGISILRRTLESQEFSIQETGDLAALLDEFARGLTLLDDYDHASLDLAGKTKRNAIPIDVGEYRSIIETMRGGFHSDLFGREKDDTFGGSVQQIYQSIGGQELYPSLEEKAAMLLYFIVKNHSFVDGNKRIAAACFLYFMEKNGLLHRGGNGSLIDNESLAAITLFIAMSKPEEMQTVKQVVISLLNRKA